VVALLFTISVFRNELACASVQHRDRTRKMIAQTILDRTKSLSFENRHVIVSAQGRVERSNVKRNRNVWVESSLQPLRHRQGGRRLPVVLTRQECQRLFDALEGTSRLMAELLYGSGLRLTELLRLRIKDIDLDRRQLTVRSGKGDKDRVTVLPESLVVLVLVISLELAGSPSV